MKEDAKIIEKGEIGEKAEEELMTSFKKLKLIENETIYTIKLVRNKSVEAIEVSGKKQNLPSPKPEIKEENGEEKMKLNKRKEVKEGTGVGVLHEKEKVD